MDEIDNRILRELQFNARLSNTDLASRVGLSASPCWNRVRALEQQGVIEKYISVFNQAALGLPDTVIIEVTLDRHDDDILKKFEAALERMPEVVEAYLMTGEYDFFIKVAVAGAEGYERFLREKLYKIPGIRHSRTSFTLRRLKQTYSVQPPSLDASGHPSDRLNRHRRRGFAQR
jgi:Lrp/AsnC family leucine-responsive transcriptional regulator